MEKNNYLERVHAIKREILGEIRDELGTPGYRSFRTAITIYYIQGNLSTTETVNALDVASDGGIGFWCESSSDRVYFVEGNALLFYETQSLLNILQTLQKENSEERAKVKDFIIKKVGKDAQYDFRSEPFKLGSGLITAIWHTDEDEVYAFTDKNLPIEIPDGEKLAFYKHVKKTMLHQNAEFQELKKILQYERRPFNWVERGCVGQSEYVRDGESYTILDVEISDEGHIYVYADVDKNGERYDVTFSEDDFDEKLLHCILPVIKERSGYGYGKRIALTHEQRISLEKFKESFQALADAGVRVLTDRADQKFYFINGSNISRISAGEVPNSDYHYLVDVEENIRDCMDIGGFVYPFYLGEEEIFVKFK